MVFLRDLCWVCFCLTFMLVIYWVQLIITLMYADYTSILIWNNCYEDISRNFNKVLYNTLKWFQTSQLVLNVEKTKRVKFTPSYFSYACNFCWTLICWKNSIKFLGQSTFMEAPYKLSVTKAEFSLLYNEKIISST